MAFINPIGPTTYDIYDYSNGRLIFFISNYDAINNNFDTTIGNLKTKLTGIRLNFSTTMSATTVVQSVKLNIDNPAGDKIFEKTLNISVYQNQHPYYDITSSDLTSYSYSSAKSGNIVATITYNVNGTNYTKYFYLSDYDSRRWKYNFLVPIVSSISISTQPTTKNFLLNQPFSYAGMIVVANYIYAVAGTLAYSNAVTGYSVSNPNTSVAGTSKTVTVTFNGKTASYTVNIYGISSISNMQTPKTVFKINEQLSGVPTNLSVTYTNGTVEQTNVTSSSNPSLTSEGSKSVVLYAKTQYNVDITNSYTITVYALQSISISGYTTTIIRGSQWQFDGTITGNYGTAGTKTEDGEYTTSSIDTSTGGTKVFSVTYNGKSASGQVNVIDAFKSFQIDMTNVTTEVVYGQTIATLASSVILTLNDNTQVSVLLTPDTSDFDNETLGTQNIPCTFTYNNISYNCSYNITVVEPSQRYTEAHLYFNGEEESDLSYPFNTAPNGLKMSVTNYKGETINNITNFKLYDEYNNEITIVNRNFPSVIAVYVDADGKSAYVEDLSIGYTDRLIGVKIQDDIGQNETNVYLEPNTNKSFNSQFGGYSFYAIYQDSDSNLTYEQINFSSIGFKWSVNSQPLSDVTNFSYGNTYGNITATYKGKNNQITNSIGGYSSWTIISVYLRELVSITITGTPTVSYIEGNNISTSGLSLSALYNDSDQTVSVEFASTYLVINGTEIQNWGSYRLSLNDDNKLAEFKFKNKKATFGTLSVEERTLSSISLGSQVTKTNWLVGDTFNVNGLTVIATFDNGDEEVVPNNLLTFAIGTINIDVGDKITTSMVSKTSLNISYSGETTSQTISVGYPTLESLEFDVSAIPNEVKDGNTLSITNLVVKGVYSNDVVNTLTTWSISTTSWDASWTNGGTVNANGKIGTQTITIVGTDIYSANTKSANLNITITTNDSLQRIQVSSSNLNYRVGDKVLKNNFVVVRYNFNGTSYEIDSYTTNPAIDSALKSVGTQKIKFYYTDNNVAAETELEIYVSPKYSNNVTVDKEYRIAFNVTEIPNDKTPFIEGTQTHETIKCGELSDGTKRYALFSFNDITTRNGRNETILPILTPSWIKEHCIGYVEFKNGNNAHVVIFEQIENPIGGDSNIEVTFPHYVEGYSEKINKCTFGKIFNGRLFLSGNSDYPNMDWHTDEVNDNRFSQLTYFSDLRYCYYGTTNSKVVGYDINREGDLIVFKESSNRETTIYKRTTQYATASDYSGNYIENSAEDYYTNTDISANGGVGALSNRGIVNFVGYTLFMTKNGIKLLSTSDKVNNSTQFSSDFSSNIDERLKRENLENSYMYAFGDKLFVTTEHGVYVCQYFDDKTFEWYFIDNVQATTFFEIDNQLYYSTDNGEINRFVEDEIFEDKKRVYVGTGGVSLIHIENDYLVVSNSYVPYVKEENEFHVATIYANERSIMHACIGEFVNKNTRENDGYSIYTKYLGVLEKDETNNYWYLEIDPRNEDGTINYDLLYKLQDYYYSGREIYFDNFDTDSKNIEIDKAYVLRKISKNKFEVVGANFDNITTIRVSYAVNSLKNPKIYREAGMGENTFKLKDEWGKVIDLIEYNNIKESNYYGVFTIPYKYDAYVVSAPLTLGSGTYYKTIYSMTLMTSANIRQSTNFGYLRSRNEGDFRKFNELGSGNMRLDFGKFDLSGVQFSTDNLPRSNTILRTLPRIWAIKFVYQNTKGCRMVIPNVSVTYAISNLMKGVN